MNRLTTAFRTPKLLVLACLFFSLGSLVPVLGPIMRESDQASILYGAVRLSAGSDSPLGIGYYNYDKQFITYWLAATAHRLAPGVDLVTLCNVLGFALFWGSLALLVWRTPIHRFETAAAVATCLLAPTLWLHSPFYSTAFVSGGFLLLAWAAWRWATASWAGRTMAIALIFLAVGARADALLALPWFVWTVTPIRTVRQLLRSPFPLLPLAAGLAAFGLGRLLYTGIVLDVTEPFFYPKIYAAYLVFGLGAAALTLVWLGTGLLQAAWLRRRRSHTAVFYALGFAALLLPWAFYSFQLYSTRYWTVLLCAMLGGLLTRRVGRLVAGPVPAGKPVRFVAGAGVALALLPVFVGLHLPFPTQPRLVTRHATLFPTGDGLQPMGALRWYCREMAGTGGMIDHNQATWLSACAADLRPDATGRVPILEFSLRSYLELSAALRGLSVQVVSIDAPSFYADTRDLLRTYRAGDALRASSRLDPAAQLEVVPAGPEIAGCVVVRASREHPPGRDWLAQTVLARALAGNYFRIAGEYDGRPEIHPPDHERGKSLALFSFQPFAAEIPAPTGPATAVTVTEFPSPRLFVAVVPGRAWDGAGIRIRRGAPRVAITIHPDYMGVDLVR